MSSGVYIKCCDAKWGSELKLDEGVQECGPLHTALWQWDLGIPWSMWIIKIFLGSDKCQSQHKVGRPLAEKFGHFIKCFLGTVTHESLLPLTCTLTRKMAASGDKLQDSCVNSPSTSSFCLYRGTKYSEALTILIELLILTVVLPDFVTIECPKCKIFIHP